MRILMTWVLGGCLVGATACATGVVGDSLGEAPPVTGTTDDGDAAVSSPPHHPYDAGFPAEDSGQSQASEDASAPFDASGGDDGASSDAASAADTAPPVDSGSGGTDAGGPGLVCGGYALPSTPASCDANCTVNNCNANGCYGTYWCDTNATRCVAPVSGCDAGP